MIKLSKLVAKHSTRLEDHFDIPNAYFSAVSVEKGIDEHRLDLEG
jgi:hypothetical protein